MIFEKNLLSQSVSQSVFSPLEKYGYSLICETFQQLINKLINKVNNERYIQEKEQLFDISERNKAKKRLQQPKRDLFIKNQIVAIFLTIPDEEMYTEALKVIREGKL